MIRVRLEWGEAAPLVGRVAVGALAYSAVQFAAAAGGDPDPDPGRVATSFAGAAFFRWRGEPVGQWDPLSGFWPTADGWIRTHANYPHHRERLARALEVPPTPEAVRARVAGLAALDAEESIVAAGGIAAAVRTAAQWRAHPHGSRVAAQPLLAEQQRTDGPARPLAGAKVLDLTRVLAGPVATRTLGLWGARVLRVDPPALPEIEWQHLDTGAGKRSTVLDVRSKRFAELAAEADVLVHGYRPGALPVDALIAANPRLVVASLSAWGPGGPWAGRRGFDSIVQAAAGIAMAESPDGVRPGALPVQALDHAAGYLLAGGVARALATGGGWSVSTSLARVAHELLGADPSVQPVSGDFEPTIVTHGEFTYARPALHADDFAFPPHRWGTDEPTFGPRWDGPR